MVTRKRLRTVLNALALYTIAALVIGYFGVNAYTGDRGLRAKQELDQQIGQLTGELATLKGDRARWERRVALLRSDSLDPDMLDERARLLLDYIDPRDLTLRFHRTDDRARTTEAR
jgi:cell division protein FtsB